MRRKKFDLCKHKNKYMIKTNKIKVRSFSEI